MLEASFSAAALSLLASPLACDTSVLYYEKTQVICGHSEVLGARMGTSNLELINTTGMEPVKAYLVFSVSCQTTKSGLGSPSR